MSLYNANFVYILLSGSRAHAVEKQVAGNSYANVGFTSKSKHFYRQKQGIG